MDDALPSIGRRLAAVVSLLAVAAAVVMTVLAFLRDPLRLVGALVLVVVVVMAGWTALVRRGAGRAIASVVAVLTLGGLLALVLAGSLLQMVVLGGLLVLAVGLGKVALGRDLAQPPADLQGVGPARHGVLIMNPRSGGGKAERFHLEDEARRRNVRSIVLHPGNDVQEIAERAIAQGADVIGVAGGDGSQALVADVVRAHDVALIVVPAGTRNHFALDLGLDRADVVGALDAFGSAVERRIDIGLLGDRVFVNNASLGVYATVVQSAAYRDAKAATTAQMAPDLLGPDRQRLDLRFRGPDGKQSAPVDVVLVSNGAYRMHGFTGAGTRARLDAGVLGVVTVAVESAADAARLVTAQASGRLQKFHGYREWTTPELVVDADRELIEVGVDGEALRIAPPLRFRVAPGALRVRLPVGAPGAAPAALAPAGPGAAVTGLLRVLAGRAARP